MGGAAVETIIWGVGGDVGDLSIDLDADFVVSFVLAGAVQMDDAGVLKVDWRGVIIKE